MKIGGLQKLSLLDFPDKTACIVFTSGCNFRCPFCHNASLVIGNETFSSEEEVFTLLKKRKGLLDGVVITGGEPLIHKDIKELILKIRDEGYSVKLDTNGTFPDRLKELIELKLVDYVAMDIKNSPERYAETIGLPSFDITPVADSIALLKEGLVDYEFRTTLVKPYFEKADFEKIGEMISGADKYYLQNFKDSGELIDGENLSAYSSEEAEEFLAVVKKFVPSAKIRG